MAENNLIVPDASVILKWALVDEIKGVAESLRLRDDAAHNKIKLIAPSHCLYEVANTLGRLVPEDAHIFLSYITTSGIIQEVPLSFELASKSFVLMKKYKGVAFYDTAYHALAILIKGTFITADSKYFMKAKGEGSIRLL